jgi:hypothetical protein
MYRNIFQIIEDVIGNLFVYVFCLSIGVIIVGGAVVAAKHVADLAVTEFTNQKNQNHE